MASPTQNYQDTTSDQLSALLSPSQNGEDSRSLTVVETEEANPSQSTAADVTPIRSSIQPGSEKRSKKCLFLGQFDWTIEAAAILLSIASMITILTLLPMYENKPLSSWSLPISLNVIVSVLGATSRAAMAFAISACISQGKWNWYKKRNDCVTVFGRFEEASRGPWGSLRLLWWTKLSHWTALGALSAVVLIGFEPFLQAVVTISGEEQWFVGTANTTSIGRAYDLKIGSWKYADKRNGSITEGGEALQYVTWVPLLAEHDFGAISAIWEGFSNRSSTDNQNPTFVCSTGNCTWPHYASLAVCSACNNVSSHVTSFSGEASTWNDTIFSSTYKTISNDVVNYTAHEIKGQSLNITNPEGFRLERPASTKARKAESVAQSTCNPGKTVSFRHLKTLIISFSVLKATKSYRENIRKWEDETITAEECALYFCTNIYRSEVEHGVLKEVVLGSYSNRNLDSYNIGSNITRSRLLNRHFNHALYLEDMATAWHTDLQLSISSREYFGATGSDQPGYLKFNVSRHATFTVLHWLFHDFSRRAQPQEKKQLTYPPSDGAQPPIINILGNSPNLTQTFDNVAASLTKWMRNRSTQQEQVVGQSREWVVRIRINWDFLFLPIGALLAGCVFCVLLIWETWGLGLPAWRGSSLATLAHGLDMDSRLLLREASDGAQIATRARSLKVRFVDSEGGPELVHGPQETKEVQRQV